MLPLFEVSTHSRLKAAGTYETFKSIPMTEVSTHSRLKAAVAFMPLSASERVFQHTAA